MLAVLQWGGIALAGILFAISMIYVVRGMRAPQGDKGRYFLGFMFFDTLAIACAVVAIIAFILPEWFGFPPNSPPPSQ